MEKFKDIIGYEGLYQISNFGNVKTFLRNKEDILQINIKRKYAIVTLYKNKKSKHYLVHRLVAIHFIESVDGKPYVNHINSIKHDNRVENLEWCNQTENNLHGYKYGNMKPPHLFEVIKTDLNGNEIEKIINLTQYEKVNGFYHGSISESIKRNRILNGFYFKRSCSTAK